MIVLKKKNSPIIELITPKQDNSPSNGWLNRIGAGSYHICFEIKGRDLTFGMDYFKKHNYTVVSKPSLSPAFNGSHVPYKFSVVLVILMVLLLSRNKSIWFSVK